jgi:hypothetical protein
MKNNILFLLLFLFGVGSSAQEINVCGTDILMERRMNMYPLIKEKRKMMDFQPQKNSVLTASYTIPIVFHILHQNGPENISDDQVRDGLRILNEDFSFYL